MTLVNFFSNNNVNLKNCISIKIDETAAMTKKYVGLIKLVKYIVPSLKRTLLMIVNMSIDIKNQLSELSCVNKLKQMFCDTT
jgi:hypothetical protein